MAKFDHTNHKRLWDWLANNPADDKSDWPGWKETETNPIGQCYACEYRSNNVFGKCPLKHETDDCTIGGCLDGLFYKHSYRYKDLAERSKLAAQIRDLPVREGVECI